MLTSSPMAVTAPIRAFVRMGRKYNKNNQSEYEAVPFVSREAARSLNARFDATELESTTRQLIDDGGAGPLLYK